MFNTGVAAPPQSPAVTISGHLSPRPGSCGQLRPCPTDPIRKRARLPWPVLAGHNQQRLTPSVAFAGPAGHYRGARSKPARRLASWRAKLLCALKISSSGTLGQARAML